MRREARPLIVRRIEVVAGHGRHGGAWKVAYADFVTAMMAFFLLLWLISIASEDTLKGLADYFSDAAANVGPPGGLGGALEGLTVSPTVSFEVPASPLNMQPTLPFMEETKEASDATELSQGEGQDGLGAIDPEGLSDRDLAEEVARREAEDFAEAEAEIRQALASNQELAAFENSLLIDETEEGLRIQLMDRDQVAMFPLGSDAMYPHTRKLLEVVVAAVAPMTSPVSIRGHTDALPFAAGATYDNWRLSSDRANAARIAMVAAGLGPARVAEVVGKGAAQPLLAEAPEDPRNRRLSIVLLRDPAGVPPAPAVAAGAAGGPEMADPFQILDAQMRQPGPD